MGTHILTGEKVAIKIMEKSRLKRREEELLSREISNMKVIRHPHVIQLYRVIQTTEKVYLIMECCTGGESPRHNP